MKQLGSLDEAVTYAAELALYGVPPRQTIHVLQEDTEDGDILYHVAWAGILYHVAWAGTWSRRKGVIRLLSIKG
jgi:hypothetical protein